MFAFNRTADLHKPVQRLECKLLASTCPTLLWLVQRCCCRFILLAEHHPTYQYVLSYLVQTIMTTNRKIVVCGVDRCQYHALLEAGDTDEALKVVRSQLTPLSQSHSQLQPKLKVASDSTYCMLGCSDATTQ